VLLPLHLEDSRLSLSHSRFNLPGGQSIRGKLERVAAKGGSSEDGSGEKGPTSSSKARTALHTVSYSKSVSPECACANPASAWQALVKSCT